MYPEVRDQASVRREQAKQAFTLRNTFTHGVQMSWCDVRLEMGLTGAELDRIVDSQEFADAVESYASHHMAEAYRTYGFCHNHRQFSDWIHKLFGIKFARKHTRNMWSRINPRKQQ